MLKCPNCNTYVKLLWFRKGILGCPFCLSNHATRKVCPRCCSRVTSDMDYCPHCGWNGLVMETLSCTIKYTFKGLLGLLKYKLGIDRTDDNTLIRRRTTCYQCCACYKSLFFGARRCSICGCFIKAKTAIGKEGCPIDKWTVPHPEAQ